jgi:hypothetical protein
LRHDEANFSLKKPKQVNLIKMNSFL